MIRRFLRKNKLFDSAGYWESRYKSGGNSGAGSYDKFAEFKAEILNSSIKEYGIETVLEFGCGDGNQLSLLNFPAYTGLDVSPTVLEHCINKFKDDHSKSFFLYSGKCFVDNRRIFYADAAVSIDVIFHLVELQVFESYLKHLFESASKLVIIYGADMDYPPQNNHELYRKFSGYVGEKFPEWKLAKVIKNRYPAKDINDEEGSLADFYFFTRKH